MLTQCIDLLGFIMNIFLNCMLLTSKFASFLLHYSYE